MTRKIRLVDTSLRDGNQSLWGAQGITTGIAEAVGPLLEKVGFDAIDFTSSTNLSMGVKFHQESPWERIARMKAVMPSTHLSAISTGMRFMSWERSSEEVMRLALRLMAKHGLSRLQIADPMNDADAVQLVAKWAKEEGFEQVVAAATFTESPIHTDVKYIANATLFAANDNIDVIYLKDPGGLLSVDRTRQIIPELRQAVGSKTLELHSHCTTGEAPLVYVEAAKLGVDVLHTGIGPLSRGTAQPNIRELLDNLDAVGIETNINREPLDEIAEIFSEVAEQQGFRPGENMPYNLQQHQHQIPGGMLSTLKRQLSEIGLAESFEQVVEEVQHVRADMGYPIMVTPFSQFVGSQSLMNVLSLRENRPRYTNIPDEILRYVLGHFGEPQGDIAPELMERVKKSSRLPDLEKSITSPATVESLREKAKRVLDRDPSPEESLLYHVLPHTQLQAVEAAGTAPRWDRPIANLTVQEFLQEVQKYPHWKQLIVALGDETIHLQRKTT